jgi:hypothetical protein
MILCSPRGGANPLNEWKLWAGYRLGHNPMSLLQITPRPLARLSLTALKCFTVARGSPVASPLTSFAKIERLNPAGYRHTLVAGTVGGESQQSGVINSGDA